MGSESPPSHLDTAYRDGCLGPGADQHRGVENPVLLRTPQLFSFEEEDLVIAAIGDQERWHRARLVDLLDGHAAGADGFIGQQVIDFIGGRAGREDRKNGQVLVMDRITDADQRKVRHGIHRILLPRQWGVFTSPQSSPLAAADLHSTNDAGQSVSSVAFVHRRSRSYHRLRAAPEATGSVIEPRRWSMFIRAELVFSVNPKPIPKKSPIGTSTLGSRFSVPANAQDVNQNLQNPSALSDVREETTIRCSAFLSRAVLPRLSFGVVLTAPQDGNTLEIPVSIGSRCNTFG